jgi:hypothetical protein
MTGKFHPDEYTEDPYYAKHGIAGSDLDMNRYELDELAEHNRNLLAAIEYDRVQAVKRGGDGLDG